MKKIHKTIDEMSDKEFRELIDAFVSEEVEQSIPEVDPRFTERIEGHTPNGGDFSIAYYYNEDGEPCIKKEAVRVNIIEYKEDGQRINETYAFLR